MRAPKASRLQAALLLLAPAVAGSACGRGAEPAATKGASFDTTQVDTVSVATMRAYGTTLNYDSVLGAADAQPLFVKGGYRYGFAKIEPERGAYRLDVAELARGRIIARISSESAYASLGLGPGMNWWWIDKKGGRWRSIVYSEALNTRSVTIVESLRSHPGYPWRQSIARFLFLDTLVVMWSISDRQCVPSKSLPDSYWLLERAGPWRTPGAVR